MNTRILKLIPPTTAVVFACAAATYTFLSYERTDVFGDLLPARLELKLLDQKFQTRGKVDGEATVFIAAADERSINKFGLWGTWDRGVMARVIDNLVNAGVDAVGLDMVFADEVGYSATTAQALEETIGATGDDDAETGGTDNETDDAAGEEQRPALDDEQTKIVRQLIEKGRAGDRELAEVLSRHSSRVVQGYITYFDEEEGSDAQSRIASDMELLDPFLFREFGFSHSIVDRGGTDTAAGSENVTIQLNPEKDKTAADMRRVTEIKGGFALPLPRFIEAAEYAGFFNAVPDVDGVIRRQPLIARHRDAFVPSLSLSLASLHFGGNPWVIADANFPDGAAYIQLPAEDGKLVSFGVGHDGRMLINYPGPSQPYDDAKPDQGVFRRVSLKDIYDDTFDKTLVKGKVGIIAVTAVGTYDQRVTPFSPIVPGVEVQAAAVETMIRGNAIRRHIPQVLLELFLHLVVALVLGLLLPRLSALAGVTLVVAIVVPWYLIDAYILFRQNLWFHQIPLLTQVLATWAMTTAYGYFAVGRERSRLKKEFSTIVAPAVVDRLLEDPSMAGLGGDERDLTVLFSDIRGFTTMSEKMSPAELTRFLSEYLTPMTDILFANHGTLDKYMGDAIMAFWGAPIEQKDNAVRACVAALDMMTKLHELQKKWRAEGKPEIDVGIGLNSGLMRVGFMGSERMRNYTLLGDNVNLGSRLEGLNKQYGTNIIISEYTYERAKHAIYARVVDAVRVKGKAKPVTILELRGKGTPSEDEAAFLDEFNRALDAYRQKKFFDAQALFADLVQRTGDRTSQMYVERCGYFSDNAPEDDWDGVSEMKTK